MAGKIQGYEFTLECAIIVEEDLAFMVRINPSELLKRYDEEVYATFPLGKFEEPFQVGVFPSEGKKPYSVEKIVKGMKYRGLKCLFEVEPCDVGPLISIHHMDKKFKVTFLPRE